MAAPYSARRGWFIRNAVSPLELARIIREGADVVLRAS
jgi:hypothetical protein